MSSKITTISRSKVRAAVLALLLAVTPAWASAEARQVDATHWTDVERIIAIGDIHGDYDHYIAVLQAAGLVDKRGKWAGGDTHLVQTGDVPDRGPDTRKIIEHLRKLQKEAAKKGGHVHTLVGNHEAMNVYGDLRYVTPGEYAAFTGRSSKKYQDLQFEHHLKNMEARDPEAFASLDEDEFRADWEKDYPLGWVEHRQAWAPGGEIGEWVVENPVVLKINDTLFMHGGLSAKYCKPTLNELSEQVQDGMVNYDYQNPGIVEDPLGPLWYRGLATDGKTERGAMVDAILERHGARRMVLGHTPTRGVVWPRFDGKIILNDVGMAAYYGGYLAFLEITGDSLTAHYGQGQSLPVPRSDEERVDYLKQVVAFNPANGHLQSRLQKMIMAANAAARSGESTPAAESSAEAAPLSPEEVQLEQWLSPDNCR